MSANSNGNSSKSKYFYLKCLILTTSGRGDNWHFYNLQKLKISNFKIITVFFGGGGKENTSFLIMTSVRFNVHSLAVKLQQINLIEQSLVKETFSLNCSFRKLRYFLFFLVCKVII